MCEYFIYRVKNAFLGQKIQKKKKQNIEKHEKIAFVM